MPIDNKHTVELLQNLILAGSVQILQDTVVGQNLHLIVRKDDGKELPAVAILQERAKG